ncbi:MAG: hypothetical protein KH415_21905 [Clostridium sp.]|nr:hypothetical protein [Clostridium sp.]
MGLILDIVDKVVPRVQDRVRKGESLKQVLYEELEKEIAQSLATTQGKEHSKNNVNDILTDKEDIDNNEIYNIDNGQTIKDLI